jgi:short-subunit dehydrogenase
LDILRQSIKELSPKSFALSSDLRDPEQRRGVVREVNQRLGPIDILVNNAGVEYTAPYHDLSEEQIYEVLSVNLEAPMALSRLVLPQMLERSRGHIVNISSLAGKSGPAFQEPYSATKAGLVGLTASLRASYRGSGVSASVVVPGFVEAGIYARIKSRTGCAAPYLLSGCSAERVAEAVLRAIEADTPEIIVNRFPIRPVLALSALSPSLGEWIVRSMGVHDFFRRAFAADKQRRA